MMPAEDQSTTGGNWPLLAGLRFALALSVVTCHVSILGPVVRPERLLWTFGGFTAVIGFFLISGYSIAHSVQSRPQGFARRRLERILPLFLAAALFGLLPVILLSGVISLSAAEAATPPRFWQYAATLLLLNGIVCATPFLLHPLWSLSCEAAYYLLAPALSRLTLQPLLALILASAFLYIRHSPRSFPDETHGTAAYCLLWAWLTGFVFYRLPQNGYRPLRAALVLLGGGLLCCSGAEEGKLTLATFLAVALALWFGQLCRVPIRAARILTFLGDLSYPLYLTHLTVLIFLAQTRLIHWGAAAVPVCWFCALAVAAAFYGGIELPFRRFLRGRKNLSAPTTIDFGGSHKETGKQAGAEALPTPAPQNWDGGAIHP